MTPPPVVAVGAVALHGDALLLVRRGRGPATARRMGERVLAGETVGAIGNASVMAPCSGVLLGLSARGARLAAGQTVVEVDPAGCPARCFQPDARSRATAERVIAALVAVAPPDRDFRRR